MPARCSYTDKKENEIFLISKEIQMGSVAKSYMRKDSLIQYTRKCPNIEPYMRRPLVIYDFATRLFLISLYVYEENLIFFFISAVHPRHTPWYTPQ